MKEKLARLRKRLTFAAPLFYFLGLLFLDFSFRWFYTEDVQAVFTGTAVVFTLGWTCALTAVAFLLPRLGGRIFMGITGAVYGILVIVHAVLKNMFGNFFSVADLLYAGEGAAFFSFAYIRIRKALLACVLLFWAAVAVAIWLCPKGKKKLGKKLALLLLLLLGAGAVIAQHQALMRKAYSQVLTWDTAGSGGGAAGEYADFTNGNKCLPATGLYHYTLRDGLVGSGLSNALTNGQRYEAIDEYFDGRLGENTENEMTGVYKGKNVIFVMMESMDTWLVTEDYMPNLYALEQESINFDNFYTPLYLKAGTFCTEFISLTGIIPPVKGVSLRVYQDNAFPFALPRLFSQEGYAVNSFHPSNPAIYNRGAIHQNLGISEYHNYADMGMDNYLLDSQMLRGYDQMVAEQPFMDFIITISGHGPYDGSMEIGTEYMERAAAAVAKSGVSGSEKNMGEYTTAVAQAMETDAFVGGLVERLEADGLLEDTVLVFYADHYGKYMTDPEFLMELKGVDHSDLLCRTPFFIYTPDQAPMTVEKYMGSVDMAPTIANLFGLPVDLHNYVGSDAFSEEGGYVVFPDGSWLDGETYYTSGFSGTVTEEIAARCRAAKERLDICRDMMVCDYYAREE